MSCAHPCARCLTRKGVGCDPTCELSRERPGIGIRLLLGCLLLVNFLLASILGGIDSIESRVVTHRFKHDGLIGCEAVEFVVVFFLKIDEFSVDFVGGLLKTPYFFFAS